MEELKLNVKNNELNKIEELTASIDINTLKIYDLESTQKILIANAGSVIGLETSNKIKTLFFLIDNKIVRSRIVTFNNKTPFNDYDKMIISILNQENNKIQYSGIVSFYNSYQNKLLTDIFENGKLKENKNLSIKKNKNKSGKNLGCTDWYWVTTYSDGRQISEYVYTTCTSCEEMAYKTLNGCGGGSSGTGSGLNFPYSPTVNAIYDYFSPEGEFIRYQFKNNQWTIILISLPEVVVNAVPESRPYLIFDWPQDQQKAYGEGFVYTYHGGSATWNGIPLTDELIAQAIEDNIDYTKLDPCSKGVYDKIKNTTVSGFAELLKKLGVDGSIYKTKMITDHNNDKFGNPINSPANTVKTPGIKYDYTVYINPDYNDKTKLYIATLLLHELAHTYFFSLVDDYNNGSTNSFNELPILFNELVIKKYPINPELHHEEIANSYVTAIAAALKEFQPNLNYEIYEDLAWAGLIGTDIFKVKHPEGSTSWQRIKNRIAAEQSGRPVSDGGIIQNNHGQPCN